MKIILYTPIKNGYRFLYRNEKGSLASAIVEQTFGFHQFLLESGARQATTEEIDTMILSEIKEPVHYHEPELEGLY